MLISRKKNSLKGKVVSFSHPKYLIDSIDVFLIIIDQGSFFFHHQFVNTLFEIEFVFFFNFN
jgi:hypothetical protein